MYTQCVYHNIVQRTCSLFTLSSLVGQCNIVVDQGTLVLNSIRAGWKHKMDVMTHIYNCYSNSNPYVIILSKLNVHSIVPRSYTHIPNAKDTVEAADKVWWYEDVGGKHLNNLQRYSYHRN